MTCEKAYSVKIIDDDLNIIFMSYWKPKCSTFPCESIKHSFIKFCWHLTPTRSRFFFSADYLLQFFMASNIVVCVAKRWWKRYGRSNFFICFNFFSLAICYVDEYIFFLTSGNVSLIHVIYRQSLNVMECFGIQLHYDVS